MYRMLPLPERLPRAARSREEKKKFAGPRFFVHVAALEMHPLDTHDRMDSIKRSRESAFVISPNAALRCVRKTYRSRTML